MIVIEGMDNSGKSTLARWIADAFGDCAIQESEGPPRDGNEMNERVRRYAKFQRTLFVRHPCVSNPIYDMARPADRRGAIEQQLIDDFYADRPLLIYCDPLDRGLDTHEVKDHDTLEHLDQITRGYNTLVEGYRRWALRHAHMVYRIGDDMELLTARILREEV